MNQIIKKVDHIQAGCRSALNETGAKRDGWLRPRASCGKSLTARQRSRRLILVAVDFRQTSLNTMEHAVTLARQMDAAILLLHVVDPIYTGVLLNLATKQKVRREAERRALEMVQALAQSNTKQDIPVTCVVRHGLPEYEIYQLAKRMQADLIVLGRRANNVLDRWFRGSVSDNLIDIAPCPVLVVKPSGFDSQPLRGSKTSEP